MLLIIPAIDIEKGKCRHLVQGVQGTSSTDRPVEMARLWRKENAKSLHVTDHDGFRNGRPVNEETIRNIVAAVDIPIELGGALTDIGEIRYALDLGMYRVTVGASLVGMPELAQKVLASFGPSKIVLGIIIPSQDKESAEREAVSTAIAARDLGIKRLHYTDILHEGTRVSPNLEHIRRLAQESGMRITVTGGVSGLEDLLKLQELEPLGVDSVVIGRAMYENRFSCQQIWRMSEEGNYPYTAKL